MWNLTLNSQVSPEQLYIPGDALKGQFVTHQSGFVVEPEHYCRFYLHLSSIARLELSICRIVDPNSLEPVVPCLLCQLRRSVSDVMSEFPLPSPLATTTG
jgi:hypothetical protein